MKRLKHLLWIIPVLLVAVVLTLALLTARALDQDRTTHQTLPASIQVRSNSFENLQEMPAEFSCLGTGISPHIEWTSGPEGTRSYALIATDWDAPSPSFRLFAIPHWVLFNIPSEVMAIGRNANDTELTGLGVVVGTGMGGTEGYLPACPPLGQHQYQFRVYALDVDEIRPESNNRADVLAAIEGHVLAYGQLIGLRTAG